MAALTRQPFVTLTKTKLTMKRYSTTKRNFFTSLFPVKEIIYTLLNSPKYLSSDDGQ